MLNGIDIVYWINLDRSPDRRTSMEELFSDSAFYGIKTTRFRAVDYKDRDVYKHFNLNQVGIKNNRPEYACFLSHLESIRAFAYSKLSDSAVALIMEDDATLEYKPYWKKPISDVIQNAPADWQIITLNYMFSEGVRIPNVTKFAEYEPNNGRFVSALAYLIKKSTAKEYIDIIYHSGKYYLNPNMSLHHADVYLFNTLNTYAYKYPYFTYKTDNDSYLHPDDLDNHKRCKLQIAKMLYGIDLGSKSSDSKPPLFSLSKYEGFSNITSEMNASQMFFAVLLLTIIIVSIFASMPRITSAAKKMKNVVVKSFLFS
jgi:GR25 family glycosyltransferase involved in LPS biosynthesis